MIAEPTLLILGAGASPPYGFPGGAELASQICTGLRARLEDRVFRDTALSGDIFGTLSGGPTVMPDLMLDLAPAYDASGCESLQRIANLWTRLPKASAV